MKSKLNQVVLFLGYVILFYVLSLANIYGQIFPFAFAMLFALAWANQKVYLLAPAYFIGQIITYHTFQDIIITLVSILTLVVPYYIHILISKPMKKYELFLFAFLSQTAFVVFGVLGGASLVSIIGSVIFGLAFLYCAITIFEPIIMRGLSSKLTVSEMVCGGIIFIAIGAGLTEINLPFSILKHPQQ